MAPKIAWTAEEVEALREGVAKHGYGRWVNIMRDPELAPRLRNRTNVHLKSKWRHMQICEALQGTKMMTPKGEGETSSSRPQSRCSTFGSTNHNILEYETAIFEALEFSKDPRGSGIITIAGFIKEHYDLPQDFAEKLGQELRRLVEENRVEKDQGFYRIKGSIRGG